MDDPNVRTRRRGPYVEVTDRVQDYTLSISGPLDSTTTYPDSRTSTGTPGDPFSQVSPHGTSPGTPLTS